MATKKKYYCISERGFKNEYSILMTENDDERDTVLISLLKAWDATSTSGSFQRVTLKSLSSQDIEDAIWICDFEFAYSANDSEESNARAAFEAAVNKLY